MELGPPVRFAPLVLAGLAELGSSNPFGEDLSLELGLSLWLRRSGLSVHEAVVELRTARRAILAVTGFDEAKEPVPLVGRSPRVDLLVLASYLSHLLRRAFAVPGSGRSTLIDRVVAGLPEPAVRALGA
jgi:hypothetical protein